MKKEDTDIIDAEFSDDESNLPAVINTKKTQVDIEFEYARSNIINIIDTSNDVLKNTAELAIESDHPKMVEVFISLIETMTEVNKSLFDIREKKMQLKGELVDLEEVPKGTTINNNAIFVGSTEELLQSFKG